MTPSQGSTVLFCFSQIQRTKYKHTVRCGMLGAEVSGHRPDANLDCARVKCELAFVFQKMGGSRALLCPRCHPPGYNDMVFFGSFWTRKNPRRYHPYETPATRLL